MTIIEKNTAINWDKVLNEEIDFLRTYEGANLMDWEAFDPLNPRQCFLGQRRLEHTSYRSLVGDVPGSGREFEVAGDITPLELWSARLWQKDVKEPVKEVFNYIKNGGDRPTILWGISM